MHISIYSYCVVQTDLSELANKHSTKFAPRLIQRHIQTLQSNVSMVEGGIQPSCISEAMSAFWQKVLTKLPEFYSTTKNSDATSQSPLHAVLSPKQKIYGKPAIRHALQEFHQHLLDHDTVDEVALRQLRAYTWLFTQEELGLWSDLLKAGVRKSKSQPKALLPCSHSTAELVSAPAEHALVPLASAEAVAAPLLPTTSSSSKAAKTQTKDKVKGKGKGKGKTKNTPPEDVIKNKVMSLFAPRGQ